MSGFSGPSQVSSTTQTQLPSYAQGPAARTLQGYENYLFPSGQLRPYPYPSQQLQGFTPNQIAGQNQVAGIAGGGEPVSGLALQNAANTQAGNFLYPGSNPFLDQTFNAAARGVTDQYTFATAPENAAQFARAGNFGGSAMQDVQDQERFDLGQNLANLGAQIYGGNYQQERQNQLQQQSMLPSLLGDPFIFPQALQQVGGQQQQFGQNVLNTAYQNQYNQAQYPYTAAQQLGSLIGPFTGGGFNQQQSQTNPNQMSGLQGLLGGGLLGSSLFSGGSNSPIAGLLQILGFGP